MLVVDLIINLVDQQNSRSCNRNCKHSFLKSTIPESIVEEWRSGPSASFGASASQDCNGDESTEEEKIQQQTKNGEECYSAEKAYQKHSKGGVNYSSTGDAFNRLHPCWNGSVMTRKVWH